MTILKVGLRNKKTNEMKPFGDTAENSTKTKPWATPRKVPADAGIVDKILHLEPSDSLVVNLPTPPSVNELFLNRKNGKGKGRIVSAKYRTWRAEASFDVKKHVTACIKGRYTIDILVERKSTKADIWNLEKAVSDLLQEHGVIANDNLCDGGSIHWSNDIAGVNATLNAVEDEVNGD